jgi:hydrogenase nickel incorporation protein HypB
VSARALGARFVGAHDRVAEKNRARLNAAGVFAVNLIAGPGAGKTSLVGRTIEALGDATRIGVAAASLDSVDYTAAAAITIEHGDAPHLSPLMLARAIEGPALARLDFMVVKNVADFVCPATYRLGTHVNVRIATVLERDARPEDQPQLFEGLDALVVNKVDRMPEAPFDIVRFRQALDLVNPNLVVLPVSCQTGEGIEAWMGWLMRRRAMQFYTTRRSSGPAPTGT